MSLVRSYQIQSEYSLPNVAIQLHTAYLAGAQSQYLSEIRQFCYIGPDVPTDPLDIDNPAELSWRFGWKQYQNNIGDCGLDKLHNGYRKLALVLAASNRLLAKMQAHGIHTAGTLQTPKLYPSFAPITFGDTTFEPAMIFLPMPETAN